MWKVICVAVDRDEAARLLAALTDAGLACRARPLGEGVGTQEIMVSEAELEEAQGVVLRAMAGDGP